MKRILPLILALIMVFSVALAESNLSDMSYNELITLQKEIVKEIMSRPEWKEVEVPAGNWKVGEDIPAGTYSIRTEKPICVLTVWRRAIDDYSDNGLYYNEAIGKSTKDCGKIELFDGMIVCVGNDVIFAPPKTLGF